MNRPTDKIVLVTGSTDGIGLQTARDLATAGYTVIVHGRNRHKAEAARKDVAGYTSEDKVRCVAADLSRIEDLKQLSDELHSGYERIDVLVNNAGVIKKARELNDRGFEMTFAVNHLSYFLLTGLILDLVQKSDDGRIVNVASQAHAHNLDFDNLQAEKFYDHYDAYSRSKLCNILFTYRLARMLDGSAVTVNALHPGVIRTKLLHAGWGGGGTDWSVGSRTSVYLATAPEVAGLSGKYFSGGNEVHSARISYNKDIQNQLWQTSEDLLGFKYPNLHTGQPG